MKRFLLIMILFTLLLAPYGCTFFGIRLSEEPKYKVLVEDGKFEIREYPTVIVAETFVEGEFRKAGKEAFRKLADYTFGNNIQKQDIKMTIPVAQQQRSEKISMTMPVVQEKCAKGWRFAFVMPADYTLETLPKPVSPDIILREVAPSKVAVIQFSGGYGDKNIAAKTTALRVWVAQKGYSIVSDPRSAWYDPPWTIPLLRRNEIQFDVEK